MIDTNEKAEDDVDDDDDSSVCPYPRHVGGQDHGDGTRDIDLRLLCEVPVQVLDRDRHDVASQFGVVVAFLHTPLLVNRLVDDGRHAG